MRPFFRSRRSSRCARTQALRRFPNVALRPILGRDRTALCFPRPAISACLLSAECAPLASQQAGDLHVQTSAVIRQFLHSDLHCDHSIISVHWHHDQHDHRRRRLHILVKSIRPALSPGKGSITAVRFTFRVNSTWIPAQSCRKLPEKSRIIAPSTCSAVTALSC